MTLKLGHYPISNRPQEKIKGRTELLAIAIQMSVFYPGPRSLTGSVGRYIHVIPGVSNRTFGNRTQSNLIEFNRTIEFDCRTCSRVTSCPDWVSVYTGLTLTAGMMDQIVECAHMRI